GHVMKPQLLEALFCGADHLAMALDREEAAREMSENRGLIAGARADLEHEVTIRDIERLGHQGDDEGLADGLAMPDRQRDILIGAIAESGGNEELARYRGDRFEHALVADAGGTQLLDEPRRRTARGHRRHRSAFFSGVSA